MDMPVRCFHCAEPLGEGAMLARVEGGVQPVCCAGCAAAAEWISAGGLGDYYRLRAVPAPRARLTDREFSDWMHPDVLSEHVREVDGLCEIAVLTDAMRCAACAWLIDRALGTIEGVSDVCANAVTGRITLRWDPRRVRLDVLLGRLSQLGFDPYLATGAERERAQRLSRRRDLLRLAVAGLGAMQAMMFAEALYLAPDGSMADSTRDFLRWVGLLVSTPVVFYAGSSFIIGLLRELRARRPGMDTLVGGSVLLAYGASLVQTVRGGEHVWFDAAVMFVFLLLVSRFLADSVRSRARAVVDTLARARPANARRETLDAEVERVPTLSLRVGDVLHVAPGEPLPADGELLDAPAKFDESLLTGESAGVLRRPGEVVLAGSLCRERALRVRVTRTGSATRIAELARLVEAAQAAKPRIARLADIVATRMVVALLVVAAAVFAAWWQIDASRAFEITLAVLVVTCPCALSLAVPTVVAAATAALACDGVLTLDPDALETLARVDRIVLDKTGTITWGQLRVAAVETFGDCSEADAVALAHAMQAGVEHPLARAFAALALERGVTAPVLHDLRNEAGSGIEARDTMHVYRLGRADYATGGRDDAAVWLACDGQVLARFRMEDCVRPEARSVVAALRARGAEPEIASGDAETPVAEAAHVLGIAQWRARQTPSDKLMRMRELQQQGRVVAMVGDGVNDAPVLAGADVSIALAKGAALAHRSADLVLAGDSIARLPALFDMAHRMRRILRQNLAWAIGYNLLALPLAAAGWIAPGLAAAGMALSSLLVAANAARLTRATR